MMFAPFYASILSLLLLILSAQDQQKDAIEFTTNENALNLVEDKDSIHVTYMNRPVLTYHKTSRFPPEGFPGYYQRSGFIHPLHNPEGIVLTDGFPSGHMHQHGIFSAWVKTKYKDLSPDFWNQQKGTGTVKHIAVIDRIEEEKYAGFEVELHHLAFDNGDTLVALKENWIVKVYNQGEPYIIDITSNIRCAGSDTLFIDQYQYGGFAFRGSAEWNDEHFVQPQSGEKANFIGLEGKGGFLTDLGKDRIEGNHTHAKWVSFYGTIAERPAGVTVLSHPDNHRYPEKVRIHPVMPYFCFAPMVTGAFVLPPGKNYQQRYRLVAHGSLPDRDVIQRWHKEFSKNAGFDQ